MSFRSEAAVVRGKLAAGDFKKPADDPYGFLGFAEQVTYGIRADAEQRRQEELMEKKEEFARKRAAAEKQAAKEAADKKNISLANLYLNANNMSLTDQNRSTVLSVIETGGANNLADLSAIMDKYTTYEAGTGTSTVTSVDGTKAPPWKFINEDGDHVNNDGRPATSLDLTDRHRLTTEQTDRLLEEGGINEQQLGLNSATEVSNDGVIRFTGSKGKDVLEMSIDEVLFELSSGNLTEERKKLLERRKKSLEDPTTYEPTTLYHADGREVIARTQKEEDDFKGQKFTTVKGAAPEDFPARELYKDGAVVKVFSQGEYDTLVTEGWSNEKPASAADFTKRTLYKEGQKLVVHNQNELDVAQLDGWSAVEPAATTDYKERTLYKEGAEVKVYSEEDHTTYTSDGWSDVKPKTEDGFTRRTLYNSSGAEVEVFTQLDMDKFITEGFTVVKPAEVEKFAARTLYNDNQEVRVLTSDEYTGYIQDGWTTIKTTPEKFVPRTLYSNGNELVVNDLEALNSAISGGWGPIKKGDITQIMEDLGVDRKTASELDQGLLKITTNAMGNPVVVNILKPDQADPITVDLSYEAASAVVRQSTQDTIGGSPEDINADTTLDDGTVQMSSEEKKRLLAAQQELGFQATIESLNNPNVAFGPSGWGTNIFNKAAGLGNAQFSPNSAEASAILDTLRLITTLNITTAFPGLRDSVALREAVSKQIPETKKFWVSPTEARLKYSAVRDTLVSARNAQRNILAQGPNVRGIDKAKAVVAEQTLTPLIDVYTALINSMAGMEEVGDSERLPPQEIPDRYSKTNSSNGNQSSTVQSMMSNFTDVANGKNLIISPAIMMELLRSKGFSEDDIKSGMGEDYVPPAQENN